MMKTPGVSSTLYRKYRSRDFDELIGQAHITTSLANALKAGRISHAYLFAGPRGTGKTTTARIFARRVNDLSWEEAQNHLDIIEIDAASNRRIDEVRDLREKVHVAPVAAKYKVYIIDEAHMLTTEAFNALLKTLEEPPAHAIFILATTEPHKLPQTIISRTQHFSFKLVELPLLTAHLKRIAQTEKIKIDQAALEQIAIAGDGSVRDSLSLLDQVATLAAGQAITSQVVSQLLGLADAPTLEALGEAVNSGNAAKVLELIDGLIAGGTSPQQLLTQLLRWWQNRLRVLVTTPGNNLEAISQLTDTISRLSGLSAHAQNLWLSLEATLVESCLGNLAPVKPPGRPAPAAPTGPRLRSPQTKTPVASAAQSRPRRTKTPFDEAGWLKALALLKTKHNSLYAVMRQMTIPIYHPENETLELGVRFQFHKRILEERKNQDLIAEAVAEVLGHPVAITIANQTTADDRPLSDAASDQAAVKNVLDILGGEVVGDA
ncbi:DNA polymerase III subunit gamma/tau [Candidatus Microgenomates bacterium]|nr:DNA polymerase III subunit gamma/tau [Candidatus Microgenomates bacterium]